MNRAARRSRAAPAPRPDPPFALGSPEDQDRKILQSLPAAVAICRLDGSIFAGNFKSTSGDSNPQRFPTALDYIHPEDHATFLQRLADVAATKQETSIDVRRGPSGGAEGWHHLRIGTWPHGKGEPLVIILGIDTTDDHRTRDALTEMIRSKDIAYQQALVYSHELNLQIRERKKAQEALRDLSRRLVAVQESERRAIARELHDEIGQQLTGLKLVLETRRAAGFNDALALVQELISRVHDLSLRLRPSILDDAGLLPALLWHIDRFSVQTQIQVDFHHSGLGRRFPTEVETAAYRLVQEALTNVARHARTGHVSASVSVARDSMHIRVEDRGAGFDPASLRARYSGGLSGARERLALLGGTLEIESRPGAGTTLRAILPVHPKGSRGKHDRLHRVGR